DPGRTAAAGDRRLGACLLPSVSEREGEVLRCCLECMELEGRRRTVRARSRLRASRQRQRAIGSAYPEAAAAAGPRGQSLSQQAGAEENTYAARLPSPPASSF